MRAPRPKEIELHVQLADTLRINCNPMWMWLHIPNGGLRDKVTAAWLKRMGVLAGAPDFVFFGPRKQVVWLELKRPGGAMRVSDEQRAFADRAVGICGHGYIVTNDYSEALDALRDLEIVTARVSA